ncbi:hypothetical protein [Thiomicrorhabdus xiamenensis]|uniref:Uncharacterized protein n=1 Tax=Thiomicrorhabdus xiamenensis TaxID=2739063 RepID=A0A7D4NJL5_9GAMM|nr:hypothetical protein [Thiomicrorhabdus xiamenensis]QKI88389.1 hypothetical protein HQN79_01770 [Thiomicrorhabdus xiamenensis]
MMQAVKGIILIMLSLSILLRPVLAEAVLLPDAQPASESAAEMHATHAHMMQTEDHAVHCDMHEAQMADSCCDHHNHFHSGPCPDCGDQCDCVKHLHIGSITLPEAASFTVSLTVQKHEITPAPALSSGMPNLPERPPQSL